MFSQRFFQPEIEGTPAAFFYFISPWDEYLNKIMTRLLTAVRHSRVEMLLLLLLLLLLQAGRNFCVLFVR
jgi:hypothetical protein